MLVLWRQEGDYEYDYEADHKGDYAGYGRNWGF
jgi:hypothetical protein